MGRAGQAQPCCPAARTATSSTPADTSREDQFRLFDAGTAVEGSRCFSADGFIGFGSSGRVAVFTSLCGSKPVSSLCACVGAGGRMRQFPGPLKAGSKVFSVFPVVVDRVLLHEVMALEQFLLSLPRASRDQQCNYADDHGGFGWRRAPP